MKVAPRTSTPTKPILFNHHFSDIPPPRVFTQTLTTELEHDVGQLFDTSGAPDLTLPVLVYDRNDGDVQLHAHRLELGADLV